jgi:hypothetical protein
VARLKHRLTHHGAAACEDYTVLPSSAVGANSEDVAFKAIWERWAIAVGDDHCEDPWDPPTNDSQAFGVSTTRMVPPRN